MKKKLVSLLMVGCLAASVFAGCGGSKEGAESANNEAESTESEEKEEVSLTELKNDVNDDEGMEREYGGVLRYGVMQLMTSPGNTALNTNMGWLNQSRAAYESLMWFDEDGKIVPQLATEYTADPEEPSITWTLREGVTFSDGSEFNAEAVARNIQAYQEANRSEVALIVECEIIDDTHIKMVLSEWSSSAVENIGCYVLYNSIEALDNPACLESGSYGTGAFTITKFENATGITYVKNENYWQEGLPYLDGIELYVFADATTESSSFQAGDLDLALLQPQDVQFDLMATCAEQIESGEYVYTEGVSTLGGIAANSKEEGSPWQDPTVRRALAYAIDKEGIGIACFEGTQPVADQFALAGTAYYNDELVTATYDPEKAKELLSEAGYPDGFETTINCLSVSSSLFQAIAANLEAVGIKCEINLIDAPTMVEYQTNGNWSGLIQYNCTYGDDLGLYMANYIGESGNMYAKGIDISDEAQAALNGIITAKTDEEKIEYSKEFTELMFDAENGEFGFVPYTYNIVRHFKTDYVFGDDASAAFPYYYNHAETWMKQE